MIKFLLAAVTIAGASAANCEVTALGNGIAAGTCTAGKAVGQTLASEGTCAFAAKAGYATTAVLRVIVDSSLIKISQPNKYLRPSFLFTAPCIIP